MGMDYVVRLTASVTQLLLELPLEERHEVIECLKTELTGDFSDQTSRVAAWHLDPDDYWATMLTCGKLANYRPMRQDERRAWEADHSEAIPQRAYMVLYLLEVDPSVISSFGLKESKSTSPATRGGRDGGSHGKSDDSHDDDHRCNDQPTFQRTEQCQSPVIICEIDRGRCCRLDVPHSPENRLIVCRGRGCRGRGRLDRLGRLFID